jgi:hypothetical protein
VKPAEQPFGGYQPSRRRAFIIGVALAFALTGCTTTPPDVRRPDTRIVPMKIASQPVGAAIFMNGEYMGLTPLTIPVEADAEGEWKHDVRIQCQVPQDPFSEDTYKSYTGYAVPKHLLFRVPKYMHWYSATQQQRPELP